MHDSEDFTMKMSPVLNMKDKKMIQKHKELLTDCCAHCEGAFVAGENKIVFNNSQWHKQCFVCAQCLQELEVDLVFMNEGRKYCKHDYKMLFAPGCFSCNRFILEGRVIRAMEHSWHAECFVCAECGNSLADSTTFKKYENRPYCSRCYEFIRMNIGEQKFCFRCKGTINGDEFLKFKGDSYHVYHFNCKTCNNELDKNFREKNGEFYCFKCFDKMGVPICGACRRPVEERVVYALGKAYHVEHFVCSFCSKPFLGTRYFLHNKDVYCEQHFLMLQRNFCNYCNQDVGDKSIQFMNRFYCVEHFRCFACDILLDDSSKVYKIDGKPICKTCIQRLPNYFRKRLAMLYKNKQTSTA